MSASPLVSVIIPAYDYERFLPEAIESALAQDWPAVEVIVVDDGSTDGTPQVLERYAGRIRAIRRPNGGLNAATTTGIEAATGDFLTFLDADDTWRPDRVRLLATALVQHPEAGLAYGDMEVVDEHGRLAHASFRQAFALDIVRGRPLGRLLRGNVISAGAMMVRASLRDHFHPIPEVAPWQDWWIATQVARVADVVPIAESVNVYRQHGANMNLGFDAAKLVELLREEVPFRRWMLAGLDPSLAEVEDIVAGWAALDGSVSHIAAADGVAPASLVTVTPEEHARAAARRADGVALLDAGRPGLAVAAIVASLALDPWSAEGRMLLDRAVAVFRAAPAEPVAVRGTVVAVRLADVLAAPALLQRWAATITGADDVTLAVCGVDDARTGALIAAVEAAGLGADDAADLVALAPEDPAAVAAWLGRPAEILAPPAVEAWLAGWSQALAA